MSDIRAGKVYLIAQMNCKVVAILKTIKARFFIGIAGAVIFMTGLGFGIANAPRWSLFVNGVRSKLPIHVMNNAYYVALSDLSQLPGWKVTIDLSGKKAWLRTPTVAGSTKAAPKAASSEALASQTSDAPSAAVMDQSASSAGLEESSATAGPPNNVRLTVQAALSSLMDLNQTLQDSSVSADAVKQKNQTTQNMVKQAQNLLWNLPRTRTLQADLQVALEDLQSQISLALASSQAKNGILPWLYPTSETLLAKYTDLHPCRITQDKTDGLDISCAKKVLSDISREDFNDVQRDLDQYR